MVVVKLLKTISQCWVFIETFIPMLVRNCPYRSYCVVEWCLDGNSIDGDLRGSKTQREQTSNGNETLCTE